MRVLVTGAAGFVGRRLVRALWDDGAEVVATDAMAAPSALPGDAREPGAVGLAELDVTDGPAFEAAAGGVDAILHAAAVTPGEAEGDPDVRRVLDVNLGGTINALEAARHGRVGRLLFVSSAAVYEQEDRRRVTEADATGAGSIYGAAKLAAELLVLRYGAQFDIDVGIVRPSAVYGPDERPSASRPTVTPISRLLDAARAGRTVGVAGLSSLRDWLYVDDLATACCRLLRQGPEGRVFTVSAGSPVAFGEIVRVAREVAGLQVGATGSEVVDGGASKAAVLVNAALRAATGWAPSTIEQGIRACVDEWKAA